MKAVILLLALCSMAYAQMHALVRSEVAQLVAQTSGLSVEDCTSKCDELFNLLDPADETTTDTVCANECLHAINPHPTHASHPPVETTPPVPASSTVP